MAVDKRIGKEVRAFLGVEDVHCAEVLEFRTDADYFFGHLDGVAVLGVQSGDESVGLTGFHHHHAEVVALEHLVVGLFVGDAFAYKLSEYTVRFFNHTPVMAMLSYSNFGTDKEGSPVSVHEAVDYMQRNYPDLAIDGEMQVNFAMNLELRDAKYPFTRLKGKDVNTLIFPNLSSANSAYKLLQSMDMDSELIGPIQMGLNKPIHFTDFESSVRDIVNITAVAVIDAIVDKKKAGK